MASLKSSRSESSVPQEGSEEPEESSKKTKRRSYLSKFGWFKTASDDGFSCLEMESNVAGERSLPTHLVIFVHGIMGRLDFPPQTMLLLVKLAMMKVFHFTTSADFDPTNVCGHSLPTVYPNAPCDLCKNNESPGPYFLQPSEVLLLPSLIFLLLMFFYCSAANWKFAAKQFVKRFPEDVVVHRGLIARYAIGKLYGQNPRREPSESSRDSDVDEYEAQCLEEKSESKIAGLEPVNFITSATPHLGSRGHKQIPILCGFRTLEKMVADYSWILRRTGKHLFLKDYDGGKPPLVLQMVDDCGELKFMQHLLKSKNGKYPHIVNEEVPKGDIVQEEVFSEWKMKNTDWEGTMIKGLNKVCWERVDVSFHKSKQRYLAHSNIQASIMNLS
ncbi:hypothetical protein ACLOJK_003299 [Asimina triloba]